MFRACELVVVNKIDLLEHVDFSMDRFDGFLDAVHPGVERLRMSARTGEGVDALRDWLVRAARPGGGAGLMPAPPRRSTSASPAASGSSPPRTTARAALPRDGRALRARRAARRVRLLAGGRVRRRHVAVEFVHPVIVGKRALPALGVALRGRGAARGPDDIAMAFGQGAEVAAAVAARRGAGA